MGKRAGREVKERRERRKKTRKEQVYKGAQPRQSGAREPNGRLSRRVTEVRRRELMSEKEAKSVVIEARKRHVALPKALLDLTDAGRPNAGSTHGILRLRRDLTADQWHAAEWWIGKRAAYLRAIKAPGQPVLHGDGGEITEADYADWCNATRARWAEIKDCLLRASVEARSPIESALDVILARDQLVEHLVGDLRLGLNAIHREFLAVKQRLDKSSQIRQPSLIA